jgi:predicted delta-1-pyrroline-5-carboxylate dehydrogenase group 2
LTDLNHPFTNEPMVDFDDQAVTESAVAALDALDSTLPWGVPVWVGEDKQEGESSFESPDPCDPGRTVAVAHQATPAQVRAAIDRAEVAGREWSRRPVEERAEILLKAADLLRARHEELNALLVRECGKTWIEAEAEYVEAVDFLEMYARAAVAMQSRVHLLEPSGERNAFRYTARGVTAVIAPWNFPLAIPTGMAGAALATGNAVVLKPAEQTPAAGLAIVEALREAGVPADVLALLPGEGRVGQALVLDPAVNTIAFTGSKAVGLEIIERAGQTEDRQVQIKRVIAEMGGKNCIIVDRSADLGKAAAAAVASAFHFAGQKCSAADRVFVHEAVADDFCAALAREVAGLKVGPGEVAGTDVTAMIDDEARDRVERLQAKAVAAGQLVAQAEVDPGPGWLLPPTVVRDLPSDSPLLTEEVFGPLLTVESYTDISQPLAAIDELPYALTGAVFSDSREVIEHVIESSPVGNLYINRKTTGAIVGRQPFGGNRRSGVGIKAGHFDYVLQFVNEGVVAEALVGAA